MADREASGLAGASLVLVGSCWLLIARVNNHEIYGDSWYYDYLPTTWDTRHKIQFLQFMKSACFGRWHHGGRGLYGAYTSAVTKINTSGRNLTLLEDFVLPSSLGGKDHHAFGEGSTRRRKRPPDRGVYISNLEPTLTSVAYGVVAGRIQAKSASWNDDVNMLSASSDLEDRREQ
jgi:hypothetical protein